MIAQTISHYKILEKLGEGGMGVVYKAEDLKLKRIVAIKFLPKRLSVHGEERERFTLEAQAASALNHPNISTIYEIDEANDETFIVMEYVDGVTLREWVRKKSEQVEGYRKFGIKESVDLAIQIAEGLEKAHDKGIIHRDIKSENIMVTAEDQRAKIMDFGLAKLGGVSKLTKTGSTVGTVAYMSPEQVQGTETDHRTDIFSFGVMCYEMLTGQLPFRAAHETAMMYEIINVEPTSLSGVKKGIDAELDRVVMKCLEKNRDERYQSMREVAVDLRRYNRDSQGKKIDRPAVVHETMQTQPKSSQKYFPAKIISIAGVCVLVAVALWYYLMRQTSPLDSLAVLPFVNVTTDPNTEYLSEGITENITNKLSQLSKLRVIPRSMVAKYKGKDVDPREVGKDLNVGAVLTGKVIQRGDELSIQTELIDIGNVSQLWGEQYNRKLSDILEVQQSIADQVAEKLKPQISGDERKNFKIQSTANAAAYQLYLKGRYYWNKRTDEGALKSMEYFKEAIAIDPAFALAYSGIADSYSAYSATSSQSKEYMPLLKEAALKAVELDDNLAEAHASLFIAKAYYDYDFEGAERELRRAISLNPNYPTAHHWLGEFLVWMGRFDEGFSEYERAIELDPLSLAISSDLGIAYYYARQYDRSIEYLKKTIDMDPNFVRTHFYITRPYIAKGMVDAAFQEMIKGMTATGDSSVNIERMKTIYAASGRKGLAERQIADLEKDSSDWFSLTQAYAFLGDKDKLLNCLERGFEKRTDYIVSIKVNPSFDSIRNEPRFIALMKKMNFPQ